MSILVAIPQTPEQGKACAEAWAFSCFASHQMHQNPSDFRAESSLLVHEEWAALVEIPLREALGVRAGGGWISAFPEQAASVSMLNLQGVFP